MNNIQQPIMLPGNIEFFGHGGTAYAILDGKQVPIHDWPVRIAQLIASDIDHHPGADSALDRMGITDPIARINQYVICMYGELNNRPDFENFKPSDQEFVQMFCGVTGCQFRGILCRLIHADYGDLTQREVEICRLLAEDNTAIDIANKLSISVNTVNTHITNILPKIGVKKSSAVAAWAAIHLIS